MESVARWIAAPVLRAWVASKSGEVNRLPRPSGPPESHAIGIHSDQVLILGGGPAVGWGVLSHELALTGALARALSRRTGRGADVYTVPVPRLKVCAALDQLSRIKLYRFDAIVVTLGVNDAGALTPLPAWERELTRTLQMMARRSSMGSRIFVAGVHPIRSIPVYDSVLGSIADSHARRMNEISASVCERVPRVTYVPLSAPARSDPPRFRDAMSYRHWAEELADSMATQLDSARRMADFNRALRNAEDPDSTRARAAAVRELGILSAESRSQFDDLISLACTTFGVRSATVSVIDADRLVHKAARGNVPEQVMLEASFSDWVIREPEGMIVPDATLDARFRDLPHVFGPPRVRFYAGFPSRVLADAALAPSTYSTRCRNSPKNPGDNCASNSSGSWFRRNCAVTARPLSFRDRPVLACVLMSANDAHARLLRSKALAPVRDELGHPRLHPYPAPELKVQNGMEEIT